MTLTAYPFDGVDTTENQYSTLFQTLQGDGFAGLPTATDGKCTPGSGMQVSVAPWAVALLAGFASVNTAAISKTIAVGGAQPRIDRIVLRINPSSNSISVEILAGTPGVTPAPPALTQTLGGVWEIPICRIAVAASMVNVTTAEIADEREFLGLNVGMWVTANRPKSPKKGQLGLNHTSGKWEWYDGAAWVDLIPSAVDAATLTGTIDSARLPIVPISKGGHGGTTAAEARSNLGITPANIGAAPTSHTHTASQVSDATTRGRAILTAASLAAAQEQVGIVVRSTPLDGSFPANTIRLW